MHADINHMCFVITLLYNLIQYVITSLDQNATIEIVFQNFVNIVFGIIKVLLEFYFLYVEYR